MNGTNPNHRTESLAFQGKRGNIFVIGFIHDRIHLHMLTEPISLRWEEKIYFTFSILVRSLSKLCIPTRNFAFTHNILHSLANYCVSPILRVLTKTLNVFAPTSYYPVLRLLSKVLRVSFAKVL